MFFVLWGGGGLTTADHDRPAPPTTVILPPRPTTFLPPRPTTWLTKTIIIIIVVIIIVIVVIVVTIIIIIIIIIVIVIVIKILSVTSAIAHPNSRVLSPQVPWMYYMAYTQAQGHFEGNKYVGAPNEPPPPTSPQPTPPHFSTALSPAQRL